MHTTDQTSSPEAAGNSGRKRKIKQSGATAKPVSTAYSSGAVVSVYASVNVDDLRLIDQVAARARPRPVSRSLMIATILNDWAQAQRNMLRAGVEQQARPVVSEKSAADIAIVEPDFVAAV